MIDAHHFPEQLVDLINRHFRLQVATDEENLPVVLHAEAKDEDSLTRFVNDLIQMIEQSDVDGRLNFYTDDELDFDTPEEFHRY